MTNSGGTDTTATTVSDTVDAAFVVTSVTFTNSAGVSGTCTAQQNVSCNVGVIVANGGTATVTISGNVPVPASGLCPSVSNQASASATNATTANSNTVTTTVVCSPNVTINKSGPASIGQGGAITYTITVSNSGTAGAPNVSITDDLDNSITGVSASISGGVGAPACVVGALNVVTCGFDLSNVNSPTADHVAVITITGNAPVGSCPLVSNQATGTYGRGTAIPPSGTVTTQVTGCGGGGGANAGLSVIKGGPARAHVGDTITYTFDVSLIPNSPPLTNVTLTDPVCDPSTLVGPTKTGGDQDAVLEAGEVWSYSCTHLITATDPDPLPNTATATGTDPTGGTVSGSGTHLVDIIHPDIDLVKEADPTSGSPGAVITYTYTVTNTGDVDLVNVSVDDDVLGHICDIAVLHPQQTVVCTGAYRIPKHSPLQITNIAIAGGIDPLGDTVSARDEATIDVVLGTTVTPPTKTPPGGVAFTGSSAVLPLGALALVLLLLGSGMLWAGRGRERPAPGSDEG